MIKLLDQYRLEQSARDAGPVRDGRGACLRYAPGFSAIMGFAEPQKPDFAALAPFCSPLEQFYFVGWTGTPSPDWRIVKENTIIKMVWKAPIPATDDAIVARPLAAEHVDQAMALAALTKPRSRRATHHRTGRVFRCVRG